MKPTKKKPINFPKSEPDIGAKVAEYDALRTQSKTIKSRMDTLAKDIKKYAETYGVKDDKGSYYCDNGAYQFGQQAKKSVSFVPDKALDFLKSHGFTDAIKTVETIDEDVVERLVGDGAITFEDLESITQTKVTYAIDLKKKEDMPVVEETTVTLAASKKPQKTKLSPKKGK